YAIATPPIAARRCVSQKKTTMKSVATRSPSARKSAPAAASAIISFLRSPSCRSSTTASSARAARSSASVAPSARSEAVRPAGGTGSACWSTRLRTAVEEEAQHDADHRGDARDHRERLPRVVVHVLVRLLRGGARALRGILLDLAQLLLGDLQALLDVRAQRLRLLPAHRGDGLQELLGIGDDLVEIVQELLFRDLRGVRHGVLLRVVGHCTAGRRAPF